MYLLCMVVDFKKKQKELKFKEQIMVSIFFGGGAGWGRKERVLHQNISGKIEMKMIAIDKLLMYEGEETSVWGSIMIDKILMRFYFDI